MASGPHTPAPSPSDFQTCPAVPGVVINKPPCSTSAAVSWPSARSCNSASSRVLSTVPEARLPALRLVSAEPSSEAKYADEIPAILPVASIRATLPVPNWAAPCTSSRAPGLSVPIPMEPSLATISRVSPLVCSTTSPVPSGGSTPWSSAPTVVAPSLMTPPALPRPVRPEPSPMKVVARTAPATSSL